MTAIEQTVIVPSYNEIEDRIKSFLVTELGVEPAVLSTFDASTPLLGHGIGLDSIEVIALALAIEMEFDIQIADQDLNVELFKDLGSLTDYVFRKRA
jgi:acyl carrier protein